MPRIEEIIADQVKARLEGELAMIRDLLLGMDNDEDLSTLRQEITQLSVAIAEANHKLGGLVVALDAASSTASSRHQEILAAIANVSCGAPQEPQEPVDNVYRGPLVGANFAGLGNNPWFNPFTAPAKLGTHYRTSAVKGSQPDYFGLYGQGVLDDEKYLVRMPYALERIVDPHTMTIIESYAAEMEEMMDAAYATGGMTILDMHNYCRVYQPPIRDGVGDLVYPELAVKTSTVNNVTAEAQWFPIGHPGCWYDYDKLGEAYKLIAQRFKDHPGLLAYGLMNEPFGSVDADWIAFGAQILIDAVREVDQEHWITVGGGAYSSAKQWRQVSDGLRHITGDRIMFEAHQYPDENGGGGGQWRKDITHSIDPVARVNDWRDFVAWCEEVGRPALAGEFGCPVEYEGYTVEGAELFLDMLHDFFDEHDVLRTQWLAGPGDSDTYGNGMDRNDGTLKPNAMATVNRLGMMKD